MKSKNNHPRIRVAAIILQGEEILLARHRRDGVDYFVLPGGGVEYGETLEEALIRELQEEASLDIRVGAPVFINDSIPPDKHRHILNLAFLAEVTGGTLAVDTQDKRLVGMEFVPVENISHLTLYPDIRKDLLAAIKTRFTQGVRYVGNLWLDI